MGTFLDREQVANLICEQQERLYSVLDARLDDRTQEALFRRSFRCSLAPVEQGRIEIHLLFLRNVFVLDELPDPKRFRFSILDVSWIASQNIRFLKKIEQQGESTIPEADAISFRTIIKRDSRAKKNFKKWSGSIRKMIQKVVLKNLIANPQRTAEIITGDAFWEDTILQTGLYPAYNDQGYMDQELVAQELLVDWQGKLVGRDVPRHPLGWDLRKLCQGFARYLVLPQLRDRFMWQFIPEGERRKGNHMATAPWHIGWYELNGIPVMSGIRSAETQPSSSGSALLRDLSQQPHRLEDLLAVAPYEITVPLFCYGIFSVIKPFLPNYPARISVNDSFSSVMKRQKEMIFLSLTGPHSKALADLFFGAFVDYGEGERAGEKEAKKRLRQLQSRVHDGVVILDEEFKNLQTFRNRAMLRDACIVLTNSAFEENQFEIRLSSDAFDPQRCSPAMLQVFPKVLIAFVDWFHGEYVWQQAEKVQEALRCIADQAKGLYQRWHRFLTGENTTHLPEKLLEIDDSPAGNWNELNDVIKLYTDRLEAIIEKDSDDQLCNTRKKEAALKWVSDFSKHAKEEAKKYRLTADTSFANDFFHFSSIRKQYPRKWANLQIALCVFQKFMKTHSEYAQISLSKPWEDYLQEDSKTSKQTYEKLFFDYLSQELEAGRVISFRTNRTADCSGWYDGAKDLFYLPYSDYYSGFWNWATEQGRIDLPGQRVFQKQLAEKGFLLLADYHSKSGYQRPDYRMIVDPYSDTKPKVSVIKVRPDLTELSAAAQTVMLQLKAQKVPRRRDALKEK